MRCLCTSIIVITSIIYISQGEECHPNEKKCKFSLIIEPRLTMMQEKKRVEPCKDGKLCIGNKVVDDVTNIITTDGVYSRLVISVNNSIPGPELIVHEDQMVEVLVTNNLHTDSVSIHFHGAHQKGTPYMDGVAFVTQCPIHPGLTFNYTFKASPHGTHWYHAHIGDQRSMGLYGPYIVKRRDEPKQYNDTHIITIQDWNHNMDPETAYLKMINGIYYCDTEGKNCRSYRTTHSVDGGNFSVFEFHSGLINGKGRFFSDGIKGRKHNNAPLTQYTVETNQLYRFRVISAATLYPFRLYVAGHKMTVVASDGRELEPLEVESFVIHTGERMDFILNASQNAGDYMIIAKTLEVEKNHVAEAILHYSDARSSAVPNSSPVKCSEFPDDLCPVFNCPFLYFPAGQSRKCITFNNVFATSDEKTADYNEIISGKPDKTFFLNFAFPGPEGDTPGSVNGRQFVSPTVSAYSQPTELGPVTCEDKDCDTGKCKCMYSITIGDDAIIDLVFLNRGFGQGWSHPVHLHGHSFYVISMGFPEYDTVSGKKTKRNTDVRCHDDYCTDASWENKKSSEIEGTPRRYPLKDTIVVPTGGYVHVRFKADNPGAWFLHCHIDLHNTNGMAMIVNESFNGHPETPRAMPRCRDYLDPSDIELDQKYICTTSSADVGRRGDGISLVLVLSWIIHQQGTP